VSAVTANMDRTRIRSRMIKMDHHKRYRPRHCSRSSRAAKCRCSPTSPITTRRHSPASRSATCGCSPALRTARRRCSAASRAVTCSKFLRPAVAPNCVSVDWRSRGGWPSTGVPAFAVYIVALAAPLFSWSPFPALAALLPDLAATRPGLSALAVARPFHFIFQARADAGCVSTATTGQDVIKMTSPLPASRSRPAPALQAAFPGSYRASPIAASSFAAAPASFAAFPPAPPASAPSPQPPTAPHLPSRTTPSPPRTLPQGHRRRRPPNW